MRTTNEEIKRIVKAWDTRKWLEEIESKSNLMIYKIFETKIKEERFYDNTEASVIFYRTRTRKYKIEE